MAKRRFWRNTAAPLALLVGLSAMATSPAHADFDTGLQAYEAGDYEEAMQQWLPLAEDGSPEAQFRIGQLFEHGQGVAPSLARAAMWYRLAAGQDYAAAQPALDGVLDTLRAREASQGTPQIADGATPGASSGGPASSAPGFEPDRDIAYAPPGQEPARVGDVTQPATVPGRDAQATADAQSGTGQAEPDQAGTGPAGEGNLPPALAEADAGDYATDGAVADDATVAQGDAADGAIDAAAADTEPDAVAARDEQVNDPDTDAIVDAANQDAATVEDPAIGDVAALDEDGVTAIDPLDEVADAALEDVVAEDASVDEVNDGAIGDLAALEDDIATADDPLDTPGEGPDAAGLDGAMPPELADALADGVLDADEINGLVEDGVLTEDLANDLVESGMLDDAALADLAEAGVLDEAALDALADNGLVDPAMLDDARAALAADGDVAADGDNGSVVDLIGDGVAQLLGPADAPAATEPQRRLITARQ